MEQRISVITLGVRDLAFARHFYEEGLGFTSHASSNNLIAFYQMSGFVFGLYGLQALADEAAGGQIGSGFSGMALAHNARTKEDVDAILNQVATSGGTLIKSAEEVFWGGYSGYFADPDGHRWEVAYNPHWTIQADGTIDLG